jgi:maltodextrin utilization protein YvdJ
MHPYGQMFLVLKCIMIVYGGTLVVKFFGWLFLYLRSEGLL